ncbi:hypothetical protein PR003_g25487 [Phytophthora rubi]|uniref:Uncharacterized protein n=1 Tax=Phytophthora rubi TaxID=129364 RepID=A0A6A4CP35_9STRA|nr:hypothetical protein PR001_g22543 [Phytophthora rubi]KAE9289691.1 hypothetical protein PR003_g25487 [Phytophthora rubi]
MAKRWPAPSHWLTIELTTVPTTACEARPLLRACRRDSCEAASLPPVPTACCCRVAAWNSLQPRRVPAARFHCLLLPRRGL